MKKLISVIIFVISINSIVSASYKEALSLYETKKYKESLAIIAKELDPKKDMENNSPNYDLRFLAAHNHWKMGNIQAAIGHFRRCAEIKKTSPDSYIDLALMMLENKRYGDANFSAAGAAKIAEGPMPYYVLGKSAMKARNFVKAKEYLEKVISFDPEFWIAYNDLGITLMELKKYSEAGTAFSAALAVMPGSAEVLNNTAVNLELVGKNDEALRLLEKANDKAPENTVIQANLKRIKQKTAAEKK
ncbi:MAG: tetratricopeptide repeat protein [Spirochaetota bacterium]